MLNGSDWRGETITFVTKSHLSPVVSSVKVMKSHSHPGSRPRSRAFSLVEAVLSVAIASLTVGGIVTGYMMSARRGEWSEYSLAAHSLALQRIEQARAVHWDPRAFPPLDELAETNFPTAIEVLDIPVLGTNIVYATNVTTISTVSTSPWIKMIRVDCSWPFLNGRVFTNTVVTYRAPDQ